MLDVETKNSEKEPLDDREQRLVDLLQADPEIDFVAVVTGKRAIIDVPLDRIKSHDDLKKIRASSPDLALLRASIKEVSQGDSLYSITLYATEIKGDLWLFVADGHQRLQSLRDAGTMRTTAQVALYLRDEKDAMELGASSNLARYDMSDTDIFSVIRTGKVSDSRLKAITGFNETKFARYKLIAGNETVADLVGDKAIGFMTGVSLIEACNKNPDRLVALERELTDLNTQVEQDRNEYLELQKQGNLLKSQSKKTTKKYWFDLARKRLESLKISLTAGVVDQKQLRSDTSAYMAAIIGTDAEWKDEIAVYNFFGNKIEKISIDSFTKILRVIDDGTLRARIEKARLKVASEQNSTRLKTDPAVIAQPKQQTPDPAFES